LASATGDQAVAFGFDAVAPAPTGDASWLRSHGTYVTTAVADPEGTYSRVVAPEAAGAYLRKVFDLGAAAGDVELRVTWAMRFATEFDASACRGVVLHAGIAEVGRAGVRCAPVQPTPEWQAYEVDWRPPEEVRDRQLNVDLRELEGQAFDVRNVRVEVRTPEGWRDVGPAIPDSAYVSVSYAVGDAPPVQVALQALTASRAPTPHRIEVSVPASATRVILKAHPAGTEEGGDVRTRVTSLVVLDGDGRRRPATLPPDVWSRRQKLLSDHPNTAGHAAAAAGVAAFSTMAAPSALAAIAVAAVATVWATGSRAALGGLVLGIAVLVATRRQDSAARRLAWVGASLVLVAVLVFAAGGRLSSVDDETVRVRTAIWQVSGQAFLDRPWTGMTPFERSARYRSSTAIPAGDSVGHAHNLGLELASLRGVFGVLVTAWVAIGLVGLAWRWAGVRGLAVLLPAAMGQLVDVTLFSSGVLVPIILALEVARRRSAPAARATAVRTATVHR
jgi:hypothetical protein